MTQRIFTDKEDSSIRTEDDIGKISVFNRSAAHFDRKLSELPVSINVAYDLVAVHRIGKYAR